MSYTNPTQIVDQLQAQNGIGENRTYEVIINNLPPGTTPEYVNFSVSTTDGYYPRGVWVRSKGSLTWSYVQWGTLPYVPVSFVNGVYYMVPDWNPNLFREPDPAINTGGGKG